MPKLNPFSLKRTTSVTDTKTFTDPLQEGSELVLTFCISPSAGSDNLRDEKTREFVNQYALGDYEYQKSNGEKGEPPAILFAGDEKIIITPQLCAVIADLTISEEAAKTAGGDDAYSFHEWAVLSRDMPNAFDKVLAWHDELMKRAKGLTKN